LLDANPLTNINNIRRINAVVIGGQIVTQADRQRMLDSLAAAFSAK